MCVSVLLGLWRQVARIAVTAGEIEPQSNGSAGDCLVVALGLGGHLFTQPPARNRAAAFASPEAVVEDCPSAFFAGSVGAELEILVFAQAGAGVADAAIYGGDQLAVSGKQTFDIDI